MRGAPLGLTRLRLARAAATLLALADHHRDAERARARQARAARLDPHYEALRRREPAHRRGGLGLHRQSAPGGAAGTHGQNGDDLSNEVPEHVRPLLRGRRLEVLAPLLHGMPERAKRRGELLYSLPPE